MVTTEPSLAFLPTVTCDEMLGEEPIAVLLDRGTLVVSMHLADGRVVTLSRMPANDFLRLSNQAEVNFVERLDGMTVTARRLALHLIDGGAMGKA